jgi:hypothetical protein
LTFDVEAISGAAAVVERASSLQAIITATEAQTRSRDGFFEDQHEAERCQCSAGEALAAVAEPFAEPGAESQPESNGGYSTDGCRRRVA